MRKTLLTAMTLLLMSAILMACNSSQESPEDTAKSYLRAMKNQDIEKMVSLFDQVHLQEIADYLGTTIEEMTEKAKESKDQKILRAFQMGAVEDGEDGRKVVNVNVRVEVDGNVTEKEAQIQLVKRDGKWWVISENL